LPPRIGVHIGSVVVEQVTLNLGLAGLVEKMEFVGPQIWVIAFDIGIVSDMPSPCCGQRKKIGALSNQIDGVNDSGNIAGPSSANAERNRR
jgi:hypothetical protein